MFRLPHHGYTIIEVMIFLVVSGLIFVGAMVAVGGRQQSVQYTQAVRDFEIQLRDVMNDVSDGYYPEYTNGVCVTSSGSVDFDTSGTSTPGTNVQCVNIGKIMMFNLGSDRVGVGTIVGINPGIGGQNDLSLPALRPTLAYKEAGANTLDLTTFKPIRFGARITKIALVSDHNQTFSSLSFVSGFSNSTTNLNKQNGLLAVNVYGSKGTLDSNTTMQNYVTETTELINSSDVEVNREFYLCLQTNDDKLARIFVGVDGVPTATKTEFDLVSGGPCTLI